MQKQFEGKTCVLCRRAPSSKDGEHVWPRWYLKMFPVSQGPFTLAVNGESARGSDGVPRTETSLRGAKLPVCAGPDGCNGKLDQRFEKSGKPAVRKVLKQEALAAAETADLGVWLLKTGILLSHPAVRWGDVYMDAEVERWQEMPAALTDWMVDGSDPPSGFSVWVYRRDERAPADDRHRLWLVTVTADGTVSRFEGASFGMAGLIDVDLLWHPGWPVDHPLVTEGRVQRLWPASDRPLDIGELPGVHPRAFGFVERATIHLTDGVLGGDRLPPLSPTLDLPDLVVRGLAIGGSFGTG